MKSVFRRKGLLMRFCVFAFVLYMAVSMVTLQVEITAKREVLEQTLLQAEEQRVVNKELERQISLSDNSDYLARIARDKLDMGLPEEQVYRDSTSS